jgi:hypothetical protein
MTSSMGRIAPSFTADRTSQPGRAATCSGVTPYAASPRRTTCGIELEDLLGLDLVHAVRAAGQRIAAGDLDHLGAEVVGRRAEVPVRRVELVEHAGFSRPAVAAVTSSIAPWMSAWIAPPRRACRRPTHQLDVRERAGHVLRRRSRRSGCPAGELRDRLGGLKFEPPAITRSVPAATICSTSTLPNFATSGTAAASGG